MKKIMLTVLAASALVACNNEETLKMQSPYEIDFADASVEGLTRAADPSFNNQSKLVTEMDVWAYLNSPNGIVLTDEDVTKKEGKWSYNNIQYWVPGEENIYYFAALAPMNSANVTETLAEGDAAKLGLGEIAFTNVNGSEDLLYAAKSVNAPTSVGQQMDPVKFTFNHLLSKVKFTFKNGFRTENADIIVKNIQMSAPKSGTINLAAVDYSKNWVLGTEYFDLAFGDVAQLGHGQNAESADERLTIPANSDQVYTIKFNVELYMGEVLAKTFEKTSTVTGVALEMGKAYNFVTEINPENLNLSAIEFDVVVEDWIDGGEVEHPVVATFDGQRYTSLQAAIDAATEGGNISIVSDVKETVMINESDINLVIDGQGNKFDGEICIHNGSNYDNGSVTIQNVNFETYTADVNFVYAVDFGNGNRYSQNITVDNCTFTAVAGTPAERNAVGVKVNASKNLVITNCEATNVHSLLQAQSCDAEILVDNVEVNGKSGVSFGNTALPTIKNATINAIGYGVRADGNASRGNLVVENVTIDAKQPIIVRKNTTPYAVAISGTNALTADDFYQVIFTTGDDEAAYVAPAAGKFTITGADDLNVYPTNAAGTAEDLAAALTADKKTISVRLTADIDLPISSLGQITGGSGEYKLGGENTENIIIDLNGKKLNITTTYWSNLGAKNDNAIFTIKNGTMTSSQATGTWNSYDLTFSNCDYVIEDVVFEKAIAFDNTGKSVTLKNVTINETHDYYAMWITASGQNVTVDGLTVNSLGRGIKIDEQYVDAPAKVTLNIDGATFNTAKKAAIMVKSAAGADVTLNNINLANVKADAFNAVWVDEDAAAYADLVTVNGGYKIVEGVTSNLFVDGATVQLAAGSYVIPAAAKGKTLTIKGTGNPEDVKVAVTKVGTGGENCDYSLDGSTVTFEGITITTNSSTYIGYARCNGTYKNCIINGTYTLYGNSTFENCTFNVSGNVYNLWTWGAPTATFTGCTFNCDGKALLLYGQANTQLTVTDCVFNDNGGLDELKAAIEIGNDYNKSYKLVVNNTTVNGFAINPNGISTGTTLWANKNSMGTDKLNVVVDGVDVY